MDSDRGEDLFPEGRHVVVDHRNRDDVRVDHLEHVVVFEVARNLPDGGRRLALRLQPPVQRDEALVVLAVFAGVDILPGQVVGRGNRGGGWARHDDLADVGASGVGEVHQRLQFRPDRDLGHHDVDLAFREGPRQEVARERYEDDIDPGIARLELLVQLILEGLPELVGQSTLDPVVDEIERPVERGPHANHAPRHHPVEVTGERLPELGPHALRQPGLESGRR